MNETIRVTGDGVIPITDIEVETRLSFGDFRPMRVEGCLVIDVRETDREERAMVVDELYYATWLGWGQSSLAYGPTHRKAARRLAAGEEGL